MKRISVVTPTFNEEANVEQVCLAVRQVFAELSQYDYEHVFIDNASTDRTVEILRGLAKEDRRIKVIVNSRNFGWARSPHYGMLQATGDAVIFLVADLQDPPTLIKDFLEKWEEGHFLVFGIKTASNENPLMFWVRKKYYDVMDRLSEVRIIKNYTGFGLYDRKVIEIIRKIDDPYPFFRGMIAEIGFEGARVEYTQLVRKGGLSKSTFYRLYEHAMLGITTHSRVPLRLAVMLGFLFSALSFVVATVYLIAKLIFWDQFELGTAPMLIGIFFLASVQMVFLGVLGEYIGAIHTQVLKRPLVVEKERINFD